MTPVFSALTVPIDGSPTAARGIAFAFDLAAGGGVLHFCNVVDESLICVTAAEGAAVDVGPLIGDLNDNAARYCRDAEARASAAGIRADSTVLHGPSVQAIVAFAHENGSHAIVIGTHGRTGVERTIFGSVAEAIIRTSSIPVIVVHEDDETRTGPVVVALDDSAGASAALAVAMHAASARGRALAIVHVLEAEAPDGRAATFLDEAFAAASKRAINASVVLVHGHPAEQVLETAERLEACMIVMGTHGRSGVPQLWFGSVAAAVARRARVPVATVRRSHDARSEEPAAHAAAAS